MPHALQRCMQKLSMISFGISVSVFLGLFACSTGPATRSVAVKPTMQQTFNVLASVLPASFDPERFADPSRRDEISQQLEQLARLSKQLEGHGGVSDGGFGFLARSLGSDAQRAQEAFEAERFDQSRFYIQELTENCVACHSRLTSDQDFALSQRLLEKIKVEELSPADRTQLQTATRQFDSALEDLEKLMASPDVSPVALDLQGNLQDYLAICVRTKRDFGRASQALTKLHGRDDVYPYLERNLAAWVGSLDELVREPLGEPSLERARSLTEKAMERSDVATGQKGLVYYLAATSVLYEGVDAGLWKGEELADAYYLLGIGEAFSSRSYWVSPAENLLESAVRTAPESESALAAFALLEENALLGWSGSGGTHPPTDVVEKLDELRDLIESRRN